MTRYQTITVRPSGPLTADVIVGLLRQLGEHPPTRKPRPYTRRTRPVRSH